MPHGNQTHGMRGSQTYTSWLKMRERCSNQKNNRYMRYGGRGIKVCERWDISFENFLADMGERPVGLTIERKDVDKDYEPGNCKWATRQEQAKDCEKRLTHNGKTQSISAWARDLGVNQSTISMRLTRYGWSVDRALSQ